MSPEAFQGLLAGITATLAGRPLDAALEETLNSRYPAGGDVVQNIVQACGEAMTEGWMCKYEGGGIRYGRVIKPSPATQGFSVDVVDMKPIAGPRHTHPKGEIDLIMPRVAGAQFDGRGAGWLVYGPGTTHRPTVTGGRAWVLYLLPDGEIVFA
ncbi:MAG: DUF4863 family protein [Betaproteobacteria bacterium]|jgi:hypothetical protein|nr:DUF4863 family protein [Betaproteobacteria bacterium]